MPGYEGGIDIRRDDKTLDCSIEIRGRNGEVHLSVSVDGATYGYARVGVDLNSTEAHELVGALKDAVHAAGSSEPVVPRSVAEARKVDAEPTSYDWGSGARAVDPWTAQDVGHVLGERD